MLVLLIFATFAISATLIIAAVAQQAQRKDMLGSLAAQLDEGSGDGVAAEGKRGGIRVEYRFRDRGTGKHRDPWTEVSAEIPAKYPLAMYVRRQGYHDEELVARGELVDVQIGDPAFDAAFLLEIAPADVARRLLDQPTRTLLAAYDPVELFTVEHDGHRWLRFAFRTYCMDVEVARRLVDQVASIARRVRDAYADADAETPAEAAGSPYRPILDDTRARDTAAERSREVAHLEQLRESRSDMSGTIAVIVTLSLVVLLAIVIAGR
jgi:hypothetical protein